MKTIHVPRIGWDWMRNHFGDELLSELLFISPDGIDEYTHTGLIYGKPPPHYLEEKMEWLRYNIMIRLISWYVTPFEMRSYLVKPRKLLDGLSAYDVIRHTVDMNSLEIQKIDTITSHMITSNAKDEW